jgi:cytochrome c556
MRRTLEVLSCAVIASLAIAAGCSGSKASSGGGTGPSNGSESSSGPTGGGTTAESKKSGELDKLMRTQMNKSYSQLVFLVFHADSPDFAAIKDEGTRLSDAIVRVLDLPMPPIVQSDQARQIYVDYNQNLRRDNEKFVAATSRQDMPAMSVSLKKIGETCSACHHFFRVEIPK